MILKFGGVTAISDFRASKLLEQIQEVEPAITEISGEYLHFIDSSEKLSPEHTQILESLLTYDTPYKGDAQGELMLVVPRPGTISPWSSKATSIARNSGLLVDRIERGVAYYLKATSTFDRKKISSLLHDRMTETVLDNLEVSDSLFKSSKPKSLRYIDIKAAGISALREADKKMGLALSDEEIDYLYDQYKDIDRNPTDLELMMFGVVNSEHCRHKIFNADWYIDGKKQPKSLFKMIKNTYENHSEDIISAYSDNSAIMKGSREKQLLLNQEDGSYDEKIEESNIVIKVETHNHPTAIAPFPGAATGSGGEIRDENATGRGAKPKMGLTGFNVSNLQIPGFTQPWETTPEKPDRIASPLEIMIKAPLGGASFNNEFGRPNIVGYFRTYEGQSNESSSEKWGYHKPIMIAGGLGSIRSVNEDKQRLPVGAKLIVIGGPSMLIGLAGGSASSMESGKSDSELDFASVQRGNAEIQRRAHEVISSCASLGQKNPIISVHDVGAGGLSNALTELVNDSSLGATFELRDIECADPSLSPMEIWCNESQERYVIAVNDENLEAFKNICDRERCPYAIVGETTEKRQLVINDSLLGDKPADIPLSLLFGGPPKITKKVASDKYADGIAVGSSVDINEASERLLRIPSVGSKKFLITIGDRSVGGLIARDQMVGPWQVPVSNCGVSAASFEGKGGEAMAMGERSPLAIIDAPASARMSIAEAITNIASANIEKLSDIKLSANWMAASGYKSEDYKLFQTVKAVGEEFCPQLDLTIPVGKDSLSMRTSWEEKGQTKSVASPISLIISAFAPVKDINSTLTPQMIRDKDSTLLFIDLAEGKTRLGGSAIAQAYNQIGNEVPDVENPKLLKDFFDCVQLLNQQSLIQAYHDRSDGGLFTTLLEMSFAGRSGVDIDISKLGSKPFEILFNEEIGAVIQIADSDIDKVESLLKQKIGSHFHKIGKPSETKLISITHSNKIIFSQKRSKLEKLWSETSYQIQKIRDNDKCAEEEFSLIEDDDDPGINPKINFQPLLENFSNKPKVAILREQGVNGQTEMAAAFKMAGFSPIDVHMQSLQDGKVLLGEFKGLAVCGGFSYGDVLGAGQGWAKGILYDTQLKTQFKDFFGRKDTFSLGVCNGCQMLSGLKEIIPGTNHWPKFLKNKSEQFEARLVSVKINKTSSIFFKDMEDSIISIPTAHGEGRAVFDNAEHLDESLSKNLITAQYVDNKGTSTEIYPLNPNGSELGVAGLSSVDGRSLIMMPHPERGFLSYQHSWHPSSWSKQSPWLRMFQNARAWTENK